MILSEKSATFRDRALERGDFSLTSSSDSRLRSSDSRLRLEHDFFRKPVPAFQDHALIPARAMLPERGETLPKCLGLFGKQAPREALRRGDVGGLTLRDQRRELRAPPGERLMG